MSSPMCLILNIYYQRSTVCLMNLKGGRSCNKFGNHRHKLSTTAPFLCVYDRNLARCHRRPVIGELLSRRVFVLYAMRLGVAFWLPSWTATTVSIYREPTGNGRMNIDQQRAVGSFSRAREPFIPERRQSADGKINRLLVSRRHRLTIPLA